MPHVVGMSRILTYAAIVLAVVMLLGSCDYKTRREAGPSAGRAGSSATDGFDEWAWLSSVCAFVSVVLLGNVASLVRRKGMLREAPTRATGLAAIALALFAVGAHAAWRYWMQIIQEQQTASYEIHIAYGLRTVTYAGALGAAVCALLVITLVAAKWRVHTTSSPPGKTSRGG